MMNYDYLSPLAQKLGAWMATQCKNGLPGHFGDDLLEAFPESDRKQLSQALAELKADGLVDLSPIIGPHLPRVGVEVSDLSPFLQTLLCEAIDPSAEADLAALVDRLHDVSRKPALGPKPRYVETVPSGLEGWSPSAIAIAQLLAEKSEHATSFDPMMQPHEIVEATGIAPADVRLGILDLREAGLLWQSEHGDFSVAPTGSLFVECDASIMPFNPEEDALMIANRLIGEGVEDAQTAQLAESLGWEPRRMNSAICYLERAGVIGARHSLASEPWRAVYLTAGDETLRFVRSRA